MASTLAAVCHTIDTMAIRRAEKEYLRRHAVEVAVGLGGLCPNAKLASAASEITSFVEESHHVLGNRLAGTTPDLRRGVHALRKCLLATEANDDRAAMLTALKAIDRCHEVAAELRHFSRGRLTGLADEFVRVVDFCGRHELVCVEDDELPLAATGNESIVNYCKMAKRFWPL
jgi:hypothetical protein